MMLIKDPSHAPTAKPFIAYRQSQRKFLIFLVLPPIFMVATVPKKSAEDEFSYYKISYK